MEGANRCARPKNVGRKLLLLKSRGGRCVRANHWHGCNLLPAFVQNSFSLIREGGPLAVEEIDIRGLVSISLRFARPSLQEGPLFFVRGFCSWFLFVVIGQTHRSAPTLYECFLFCGHGVPCTYIRRLVFAVICLTQASSQLVSLPGCAAARQAPLPATHI